MTTVTKALAYGMQTLKNNNQSSRKHQAFVTRSHCKQEKPASHEDRHFDGCPAAHGDLSYVFGSFCPHITIV